MATYKQIQQYIKTKYGFAIKTCWIADVKSHHGLTSRQAPNRISPDTRVHPCPSDKVSFIVEALKSHHMI